MKNKMGGIFQIFKFENKTEKMLSRKEVEKMIKNQKEANYNKGEAK